MATVNMLSFKSENLFSYYRSDGHHGHLPSYTKHICFLLTAYGNLPLTNYRTFSPDNKALVTCCGRLAGQCTCMQLCRTCHIFSEPTQQIAQYMTVCICPKGFRIVQLAPSCLQAMVVIWMICSRHWVSKVSINIIRDWSLLMYKTLHGMTPDYLGSRFLYCDNVGA